MKVCVIRNAEIDNNAGLIRIVDAIKENKILLITRSRFGEFLKIKNKKFSYNNEEVENVEINLRAENGRGLMNILNLLVFQLILFYTLLKEKKKYDIIHCFDLDTGLVVKIVSFLTKKDYTYHIADFYVDSRKGIPTRLKKILRNLEFSVINSAKTTIVCTEERVEQIKGSSPKDIVIIHNTPSTIIEGNNEEIDSVIDDVESMKICYIGSLSKTRFIKELVNVVKNNKNFNLEIGGIGELSEWLEIESEKYSNINFLGRVNYHATFDYYTECDLMISVYDPEIPNHLYSAPNKVYEAMMLGKPIIAAKGTGLDTIINDNDIGYLINYSEKDFQRMLDYIILNKSELHLKALNSKKSYEFYSWNLMKERLKILYSN